MLNVIMPIVVMLSVVAPFNCLGNFPSKVILILVAGILDSENARVNVKFAKLDPENASVNEPRGDKHSRKIIKKHQIPPTRCYRN
jgi:hypothetical protein